MKVYKVDIWMPDFMSVAWYNHHLQIRRWLRSHLIKYRLGENEYDPVVGKDVQTYTLYDGDAALLFKLTWGGQ